MKKHFLLLLLPLTIINSNAQTVSIVVKNIYFNQVVNDTLYTDTHSFDSLCINSIQNIRIDSSLLNIADGIKIIVAVQVISAPVSGPSGIINNYAEFTLDSSTTDINLIPSSMGSSYQFWIKVEGTPTKLNQIYPCRIDLSTSTCSCCFAITLKADKSSDSCRVSFISTENNPRINTTIYLYPNPTSAAVTITGLRPNETNNLYVTDIWGRIILSKQINNATGKTELDIAMLPKGAYIIRLQNKKGAKNIALMKTNQ